MKKYFTYLFTILIISVFTGFLILKFESKDNKELENIKVAEVTHSIFYAPFYTAIENGYFEDEGINIELILTSGSDNVAASVLSGDTQVGLAGPESAIYVYNGGEKDYLQVFAGLTKRDGQFILSRNKNFKWEDLIGKEILIGRSTGMPGLSFMKALENKGIDKAKVKINDSVEFAELSGTFIGGVGDYVNLFEPTATKLENNKQGYVQVSVGLASNEFPYTAFYSRKSYLNNNQELLTKFTNALNKGIKYVHSNKEDVVAEKIHSQFKDASINDLTQQIKRYKEADVWLNNSYIEKDFYNTLNSLLLDNDLIKKSVDYNKIINNMYEK